MITCPTQRFRKNFLRVYFSEFLPGFLRVCMRFVVSCLVSIAAGQKYFDASKTTQGVDGHFDFLIDGKYKMTLDTGASATWIKMATITPGGYRVKRGTPVLPHYKQVEYPFQGNLVTTIAVMATMDAGRGIKWKQLLPLVDTHQESVTGIDVGVIGGSYGSAFAKANPVLTIVPHKDFYRIYADESVSVTSPQCAVVPVSRMGQEYGKWMLKDVTLTLSTGHSMVLNFEVDTGFPALALPEIMWKSFHRSLVLQGAKLTNSPEAQTHRYSNCHRNKIPSITYGFGPHSSQFTIPPSTFATFYPGGICDIDVLKHDTGMYEGTELSFIGVPVLKSVVTQLNRKNKTVSFCPLN